jgi:protein-disulfide isomerase
MSNKSKGKPQDPKKDNFTRNLVVVVIVGVLLIMLVPTLLSNKTDISAAVPSSVSVEDDYGIVFNRDLKDVPQIDIYQDFQCPVCAEFEKVNGVYIEDLIDQKKARVVYHVLSFLGQRQGSANESARAANASACAADEGQFLPFQRLLYSTQPQENSGVWTPTYLKDAGAAIGITNEKFSTCVLNSSYAVWVDNVATAGAAKNVNSTPTVFVNGKEIDRETQYFDPAGFKAAVEQG